MVAPEKYLSSNFRKGISVFSLLPKNIVEHIIENLRNDLKNGIWDNQYKYIRELKRYNGGYFFLIIKKE